MNFAIVENNVVVNVIVVESLEIAQGLTDLTVVSADELSIGPGSFKQDDKWYPLKPEGDFVWHERTSQWVTLDDFTREQNTDFRILSQEEVKIQVDQILSSIRER